MAEPALAALDLRRAFGGIVAVGGVSLDLVHGEVHALIGPNGAGKTTFVNLVTGETAPDGGTVRLAGRDVTRLSVAARARAGLGRSFQRASVLPRFTARENVALALEARCTGFGPAALLSGRMRARRRRAQAEAALDRMGLGHLAEMPAEALAHGQKRRLELAMVLALEPRVLVLDEPMAGLGPEEAARLLELLLGLKHRHAILLVEHDMDAVFALADRVSVLVNGRLIASGEPSAVRADPEARRAYLGEEAAP